MELDVKDMSIDDLREKCERDIYLELCRVGFDDEKRKPLINELKTHAEIRNNIEQSDNTRLNNNARNEIEEQKLLIEQQRLKLDRQKIGVDISKIIFGVTGGVVMTVLGYNMDVLFQRDNRVQDFAKRIHEWLVMKR